VLRPSKDDLENFVIALRLAADVASEQARNSGKPYVVASASQSSPAVYLFASNHPDAGKADMIIMVKALPDARRIPRDDRASRH
jgi:hypothetical protein